MQQVRIQRRRRPSARPGDPPAELLPSRPASDTTKATDVVGRIDRLIAGR